MSTRTRYWFWLKESYNSPRWPMIIMVIYHDTRYPRLQCFTAVCFSSVIVSLGERYVP